MRILRVKTQQGKVPIVTRNLGEPVGISTQSYKSLGRSVQTEGKGEHVGIRSESGPSVRASSEP